MVFWDLLTIVGKIIVYLGAAAAIGGPFIAWLTFFNLTHTEVDEDSSQARHIPYFRLVRRYCLTLVSIALLASAWIFLSRVGSLAEAGISGLFDRFTLQITWESSVGDAFRTRLAGFALALITLALGLPVHKHGDLLVNQRQVFQWLGMLALYLVSLLLILRSFSATGHTTDLAWGYQLILSLHVLVIGWWLGSLWPLWRSCDHLREYLDRRVLYNVMRQFGQIAVPVVTLLVVAGVTVAYQLLDSWSALIKTGYGQLLAGKLTLVVVILNFGALHKFVLVPHLATGDIKAVKTLKGSIFLEMLVGLGIVSITAVLTTVVGPQ